LFLWVEKRDMSAEYFLRCIAGALGIAPTEVGMAGLKDRRAITRQWISVPLKCAGRVAALAECGIKVLREARHHNKLRPGHLHGNRFEVRLRAVHPEAATRLPGLIERLRRSGFPNYYGEQRFGRGGETVRLGLDLVQGATIPAGKRWLRKLALSAVQSLLFNHYVARRLAAGQLHTVLRGDVMFLWPQGGTFIAKDPHEVQPRFDAREVVPAGPMFGKKMRPAADDAAELERTVLAEAGLTPDSFSRFGALMTGTRRPILALVPDLEGHVDGANVWLRFSLGAGSYATVLLSEICKTSKADATAVEAAGQQARQAPEPEPAWAPAQEPEEVD
jgi:tRNA pseudouridine13 synthase